ncbi:hypothetical protein M569_12346, partial [Genlisea aurea]
MDISTEDMEEYAVPSHSSWFSWNDIHEVERLSLTEFFNGSSITRSPRVYKEYRDFIITKYRENPSRKLTFTEVRKSLVGDISLLLKGRVKVEEGAPYGVRVVAAPNSMKSILMPPPPPSLLMNGGGIAGDVGDSGFRWPPLASYSDVYAELMREEKRNHVCGSCKECCNDSYYEDTKDATIFSCDKCFKAGNYGEGKTADDFKLKDTKKQDGEWTEAETLLLLESVAKHGDDWELVARNVQTKSKQECILKLIAMPFGNLLLGSGRGNDNYLEATGGIANSKQSSMDSEDLITSSISSKDRQNEEDGGPAMKKMRSEPSSLDGISSDSTFGYSGASLNLVAGICKMVGPHVVASAADAAVTALCYENQCSRDMFNDDPKVSSSSSPGAAVQERYFYFLEFTPWQLRPPTTSLSDHFLFSRTNEVDDRTEKPNSHSSGVVALNLRTRAASAAALGAAAANARCLADGEEREMGHLLAVMIEAQAKKVEEKLKKLGELESMMEGEEREVDELEVSLVSEKMRIL